NVLDALPLERVPRGERVRVEVVSDRLRGDREEALEVLDPLDEAQERLVALQVADVVADPGSGAADEAEGALELGPAGEERPWRGVRAPPRGGGLGPPPSEEPRPAPPDRPPDRIIRVDRDGH